MTKTDGSPWAQQWLEVEGPWVYTFHGGGWMLADNERDERVSVRFQLSGQGRLVPVELRVDGPMLDSTMLRRLPLTIMETLANSVWRNELQDMLGKAPAGDLHDRRLIGQRIRGDPSPLRLAARLRFPAGKMVLETGERVPPGAKPDSFYRQVAKVYSHLATASNRPAVVLAEANDVPVTTVHRWVKEARRRGFLPPGQKGRRG